MIRAVPYKVAHLQYILDNGLLETSIKPLLTPSVILNLEKDLRATTILENEIPVLVGSIKTYWPGRAEGWCIFGKPSVQGYPVLTRLIKRYIEKYPVKRLEMTVAHEFKMGARWARILGFKLEAPLLKCYQPDGSDASLYVKVRE